MNARPLLRNPAASIRQRLLNLSKTRGESFDLTLTRYGIERFLYRLSRSPYAESFVLKGALLFALWLPTGHRPTRDLDLLGYGDSSSERLMQTFRAICSTPVEEDGLAFNLEHIRIQEIREGQVYGGQRVHLEANLGEAVITVKIDIGFGDVITPAYEEIAYPTLLDLPAPHLRAYPRETFLAEKVHAVITLGVLNSRLKDFYDIWAISQAFSFEGQVLQRAIKATFERRQTPIPTQTPIAFAPEFSRTRDRITQWRAFLRRNGLDAREFEQITEEILHFLAPLLEAAATDQDLEAYWPAGGPWRMQRP